ncbi:MAG: ISAs1 family transposase [Bacteroidetes bacterium]|nr:MAG: ISAs1 family transposase [Bacteroidota bacterium]
MAKNIDIEPRNSLFMNEFSNLTDPRRTNKGNFIYPLNEILFLTISAVVSGMKGWSEIELFGKSKLDWLQQYFPYQNGIPSHDVLSKVFSALNSEAFSHSFISWINSISDITQGEVIAIDGKTIRGSGSQEKSAMHIVSAYACENRLCLAQEATAVKSNEIIAIPKLLDLMAINGCVVTIDALGCQKKIAKKIIEKQADYVLMVKDNQKNLKIDIEQSFKSLKVSQTDGNLDSGHGRIETRTCEVIDDLSLIKAKLNWKGLQSIIRISSERTDKKTNTTSRAIRYYISSIKPDAIRMNQIVRDHWKIENNLHWNLDVIFNEDAGLKKKGNSPFNFNIVSKIALTLIEQENATKMSKNARRIKAALDDKYRELILKV